MGTPQSTKQIKSTGPVTRVLIDTRQHHWDQNPYIRLLVESTRPEIEVVGFSWRRLIFGGYNALHLHWPEYLLKQPTVLRRTAARGFVLLTVLRLWILKVPVVRTMHNKTAHVGVSWFDSWLLQRLDARVATRIWLAERSDEESIRSDSDVVIPHGDYSPWVELYREKVQEAPGRDRFVCFGIMRRYKRFEEPAGAVLSASRGHLTLAGVPADEDYARELEQMAAANPSAITYIGRRLDDAELVSLIEQCDIVVVPYEDLYNSGVILLALSLERPVALRDSVASRALESEFGSFWIRTYQGSFEAQQVAALLDGYPKRSVAPHSPDRSWPQVGRKHRDVYLNL